MNIYITWTGCMLAKLEAAGLRLKQAKCAFMLPSVDYLGHTIMLEGLQPTKEKVHAIVEAPAPQKVSQLRSFLTLFNYYIPRALGTERVKAFQAARSS